MSVITVLHGSESPIVGSKAPRLRLGAHTARCGLGALGVRCGLNVIHALAALSALALGGCSLLLDTSAQQCSANGDCRARGGAFTNATCVNHVCVTPSSTSTTTGSGSGGGGGGPSGEAPCPPGSGLGCVGDPAVGKAPRAAPPPGPPVLAPVHTAPRHPGGG